jgi:hypothetical protein
MTAIASKLGRQYLATDLDLGIGVVPSPAHRAIKAEPLVSLRFE